MSEEQTLFTDVGEIEQVETHVVPTQDMSPTDHMIQLAISGNADLEKLEKLLDLKAREEARQAKTIYNEQFSKMQAEFTPVARSKAGHNYNYAPIEALQAHYGPVIAKYGFSYTWREETVETAKRCVMRISGHGHTEETFFDVPPLAGTSQMNPVQVAGAMSTYGRRYTFIAGFGVIISDEDDDADLGFSAGVAYAKYITAIDEATDHKVLYDMVVEFVKELRTAGDNDGADLIKKYYTQKKGQL